MNITFGQNPDAPETAVPQSEPEPVRELTEEGIRADVSVIISRPQQDLYQFWRDFQNLPQIMQAVREIEILSPTRSRWVLDAAAGASVKWEAAITQDKENEMISWHTLPESEVNHSGTIRFLYFADGETEVRVSLQYLPPGGSLADQLAHLSGSAPDQLIRKALQNFKALMEEGSDTGSSPDPILPG